jgi:hypothetical protein
MAEGLKESEMERSGGDLTLQARKKKFHAETQRHSAAEPQPKRGRGKPEKRRSFTRRRGGAERKREQEEFSRK